MVVILSEASPVVGDAEPKDPRDVRTPAPQRGISSVRLMQPSGHHVNPELVFHGESAFQPHRGTELWQGPFDSGFTLAQDDSL